MPRTAPAAHAGESAQPDLFGSPPLSGLGYADSFISTEEECALVACIDKSELAPFRFQQWTGKRLTRSFGWNYDFVSGAFAPDDPIPEWLHGVRERAARFAGLDPDALVQTLLIRYDPGASIGWHRDRPVFGHVLGISLGAAATLRFRRRSGGKFERVSVPLGPRSIYHLSGEARHAWEHSIPAGDVTRWSITFRSLPETG